MEKPPTSIAASTAVGITNETVISEDTLSESITLLSDFLEKCGVSETIPSDQDTKDFYSHFIRGCLKVLDLQRGQISCILSVKPPLLNSYGGLHGGAVAAVAEMVSIACARTVVKKDKELFLGELGMTYLSAAPLNAEVKVYSSIVRSGRNLTVVAIEFRLVESGRLVYTSRATFYNMPLASL